MNTFKIGTRIELPVHYDWWMRGARYGVITSHRRARAGLSAYVYVKLDALPTRAKRVKVWWPDLDYAKVIS